MVYTEGQVLAAIDAGHGESSTHIAASLMGLDPTDEDDLATAYATEGVTGEVQTFVREVIRNGTLKHTARGMARP